VPLGTSYPKLIEHIGAVYVATLALAAIVTTWIV
jgi:hypothetical protein